VVLDSEGGGGEWSSVLENWPCAAAHWRGRCGSIALLVRMRIQNTSCTDYTWKTCHDCEVV
jgi:hypothetical protein